jgi:hypothetical protein
VQTDNAMGPEPTWDHAATVEDFAVGDQLAFSIWRRQSARWDKLVGRASLTPEQLKEPFDGDLVVSSPQGGDIVRLHVTVNPIVPSGENIKTGLLHMHVGDVTLVSQSKPARSARSVSPTRDAAPDTESKAELNSLTGKKKTTTQRMRINTGRQEAAMLMQGPHVAFMLPPGERSSKGGYHMRDFRVSEKVSENQEPGQALWGKLATGRLLTSRPGDSTEGVAGKVNVGEIGRAIGQNQRGRGTGAASLGKPNHNPIHGAGGFYSQRGCSEPPAAIGQAGGLYKSMATGVSNSHRGVMEITSKVHDPGRTIYRQAACAR